MIEAPRPTAPGFRALWKFDLGFVACVIALYNEVVFGAARVVGRDVLLYLLPVGAALREGYVGNGSLLWDSTLNHGIPVAARWAPMVFYPGQWLNAVFEADTALSIAILLHLVLAASATLRLTLRYTESLPAAWVAGFSYACGGYLISVSVGGGYLFGAALLPVSLLSLHRLAELPTIRRMGQLACVLALQIFCADPQTLFYEAVFLAPLIVVLHRRDASSLRKRLGMAAAAGAFAVGIGACQWLPSSEFSALSVRAGGISADSGEWAFHPLRLISFFSPHVLGSVTPQNTFWPRSLINSPDLMIPWAPLVYNGLLLWAGIAVIDWRRRLVVVAAASLFFLLLAFGEWGPLFRAVLFVLPGAKFFRYPEKFMVFFALGLCVLGAAGLARFLADLHSVEPAARRRRLRVLALFGVGGAGAVAARIWLEPTSQQRLAWFAGVVERQGAGSVVPEVAIALVAESLTHTAVVCCLIVLLCLSARRLRATLPSAVLFLVAIADVLPASLPQRYLADSTPYQGAPATCAALPPPVLGLRPLVWRHQPPEFYLREPTAGETRFEAEQLWYWQTLRANSGARYCIRQVDGYEAARLSTYGQLWSALKGDNERRLKIFGVQNIVAQNGSMNDAVFPLVIGSDELEVQVHRVRDPLPYAHVVGRAEAVADVAAAVRRVAEPAFDFTQALVLERSSAAVDFQTAPRRATVRMHRAGEVVVDVELAAAGYLMLEETYFPGWRAQTELGPLVVERANAHFLAVELPAGAHAVRFVFDPPVQRRGNLITALALALLLVVQVVAVIRARA